MYRDFDAIAGILEPITWKLHGKDYEISGDPSITALISMQVGAKEGDHARITTALEQLCGKENWAQMEADGGMGAIQLMNFVKFMGEAIQGSTRVVEGKTTSPVNGDKSQPMTSSPALVSSPPISTGITESDNENGPELDTENLGAY